MRGIGDKTQEANANQPLPNDQIIRLIGRVIVLIKGFVRQEGKILKAALVLDQDESLRVSQ